MKIHHEGILFKLRLLSPAFACFLLILGVLQESSAQSNLSPCIEINCNPTDIGTLQIELVRQPQNCNIPTNNLCAANNSYQVVYIAYLRYNSNQFPPTPAVPFRLQYNTLAVDLDLVVTAPPGSTVPTLSRINKDQTEDCYTANGGLGDVLDVEGRKLFYGQTNTGAEPCGEAGREILFTTTTAPTGAAPCFTCAWAELFTVVVDAYPGEFLDFDLSKTDLIYFDDDTPDQCEITALTSGTSNGFGSFQVPQAGSYSGTINEPVSLKLGNPYYVNGEEVAFDVSLFNKSPNALKIYNLDFIVAVELTESTQLTTTGSPYSAASTTNNGTTRYLRYNISESGGVTLAGQSTLALSTITVGRVALCNKQWNVTARLIEENRISIKSSPASGTPVVCTRLQIDQDNDEKSQFTSNFPDGITAKQTACTGGNLQFFVEKSSSSAACSPVVRIGLESALQAGANGLSFSIDFEVTGSLAIKEVQMDNTWATCPTSNGPCNGATVADCVSFSGNSIEFCYNPVSGGGITVMPSMPRFIEVYFEPDISTMPGCVENAIIRCLYVVETGGNPCIPPVRNGTGFPICPPAPYISGFLRTEGNQGLEEADVTLTLSSITQPSECIPQSCNSPIAMTQSTMTGEYGICGSCEKCQFFDITPIEDDNHINGVSTFDLVLISKHILGIEPLTSLYKMIAADANKSGSITTFDIVELRKLILGVYTELPNNTSWRFVPKSHIFPNPLNPFQEAFPEKILIDFNNFPVINPPPAIHPFDFVAIKIGDLNGNAVANSRPVRSLLPLTISLPAARNTGDMLSVPVYYKGDQTLEAFQLGLKFDPEALQLIGPSKGDLNGYDPGLFNLSNAAQGEIRALWYPVGDPSEAGNSIAPDAVLFYLHFKVLKSAALSENIFQLDASGMECLAWKGSGEEFSWELQAESAARTMPAAQVENAVLSAKWQPNPTVGTQSSFLVVQSREAGPARLYLTDASGKPIVIQDINMESGENKFEVPAMSTLPAGVYGWKVRLRKSRTDVSGTVIKQ